MAYFQQIDELLKPKQSNLLAPQAAPGDEAQPSAALTAPQASTTIKAGGAPNASAGETSNAAQQGKSAQEYTKVGYNPKTYAEKNQGAGSGVDLSKDVVTGAAQATKQLQEKSAEFAKNQPATPTYSEQDVKKGISGDQASYDKLQKILNPQPLTPDQKEPDFSSLKAPEIVTSADTLAAKLRKASEGGNYTQGMSNFDAAMYKRSGQYQDDLSRAQKAVDDFNSQLDAEIAKWKGTDRGAELQAAKDQLSQRLGKEASDITSGLDKKLEERQALLNNMPTEARAAIDEQFNSLLAAREKEISDRRNYLNQVLKDNPGVTSLGDFNKEVQAVGEAIKGLEALKKEYKKDPLSFIDMGTFDEENPDLKANVADVTTQDEAERFANISELLGKGDRLSVNENPDEEIFSPELNEKDIQQRLADLINLSDYKYDTSGTPYGGQSEMGKVGDTTNREASAFGDALSMSLNPNKWNERDIKGFLKREGKYNEDRKRAAADFSRMREKEAKKVGKKIEPKGATKKRKKYEKEVKKTEDKGKKAVKKVAKEASKIKPKW